MRLKRLMPREICRAITTTVATCEGFTKFCPSDFWLFRVAAPSNRCEHACAAQFWRIKLTKRMSTRKRKKKKEKQKEKGSKQDSDNGVTFAVYRLKIRKRKKKKKKDNRDPR